MPLTGKETVKLVLENGWVEIRQGEVIIILRKRFFLILSRFQFMEMKIWGRNQKDSQRFRIVIFTFLSLFISEVVEY